MVRGRQTLIRAQVPGQQCWVSRLNDRAPRQEQHGSHGLAQSVVSQRCKHQLRRRHRCTGGTEQIGGVLCVAGATIVTGGSWLSVASRDAAVHHDLADVIDGAALRSCCIPVIVLLVMVATN
jgi:hypothetical protein